MSLHASRRLAVLSLCLLGLATALGGQSAAPPTSEVYRGLQYEVRTDTVPRPVRMHVAQVDLGAPGVRVSLSPPGGTLEAVRRTTLEHVRESGAQLGVNAHFFLPFPSTQLDANLIGIAASEGRVFSPFESPVQSYALVANAPGINIDPVNRATVVHRHLTSADSTRVAEPVTVWTTVSGSAQIVTDGVVTIPIYRDALHPEGRLTPGGPGQYSNERSWYDAVNARTAIGISRNGRTLTLVVVDARGGSQGMTVREVAEVLVRDYAVWNALNLDGGGSASMVLVDPATRMPRLVNSSADGPDGRAVGSSLLVFAQLVQ